MVDSLKDAIRRHLPKAWEESGPRPDIANDLSDWWHNLAEVSKRHLVQVVYSTMHDVIISGELKDDPLGDFAQRNPFAVDVAVSEVRNLAGNDTLAAEHIYQVGQLLKIDATADELQAFLQHRAAHPRQQDDWQECTFDAVKDIDEMVLFEFKNGSKIQGRPEWRNKTDIHLWVGDILLEVALRDAEKGKATIYRKPKKIVHPDPAEHPVILIPRYNGVDRDPHLTPVVWDGRYYKTVNETEYFSAKDITNWTPAKVVATND